MKPLLKVLMFSISGLSLFCLASCGKDEKNSELTSVNPQTQLVQEHRTTKEDYIKSFDQRLKDVDEKIISQSRAIDQAEVGKDNFRSQANKLENKRAALAEKRNALLTANSTDWPKIADSVDKDLPAYEASFNRLNEEIKFAKGLDQLNQQKNEIVGQLKGAKDDAKSSLQEKWKALQVEQDKLSAQYDKAVEASDEEWQKVKKDFQDQWDSLEKKMSRFSSEVKEHFKALTNK